MSLGQVFNGKASSQRLRRAISCALFNILNDFLSLPSVPATVIDALGSPTLLCMLGSRMFFNLKEAAEHSVNLGTNWSSGSHSAIRFEKPHRVQAAEER